MSSAAIIGSREATEKQFKLAKWLASQLSRNGVKIVTGAAYNIDQAAMEGALPPMLEVILPWREYNRHIIPTDPAVTIRVYNEREFPLWKESVYMYHPNSVALSRGAVALHARNYGIVKDRDLVIALPVESGKGGTAQGVRVARAESVHVIELDARAVERMTSEDAKKLLQQCLQIIGVD